MGERRPDKARDVIVEDLTLVSVTLVSACNPKEPTRSCRWFRFEARVARSGSRKWSCFFCVTDCMDFEVGGWLTVDCRDGCSSAKAAGPDIAI